MGNDDSAALTVQADHPPAHGEAPDRAIKWGWWEGGTNGSTLGFYKYKLPIQIQPQIHIHIYILLCRNCSLNMCVCVCMSVCLCLCLCVCVCLCSCGIHLAHIFTTQSLFYNKNVWRMFCRQIGNLTFVISITQISGMLARLAIWQIARRGVHQHSPRHLLPSLWTLTFPTAVIYWHQTRSKLLHISNR